MPKGRTNNPKGRPKGTPNKSVAKIRDMIVQAAVNKGGVKYLEEQAEKNPTAFMSLLGKAMPTQVTGPEDGPIKGKWTIEFVDKTTAGK